MGLTVKLLHSSHGSDSQLQPLTCFLINGSLAIDAGSLGLGLAPEEQGDITDVIVTHPHADHMATLPIHIAEAFTVLKQTIRVHGTVGVIQALKAHTFNDHVWPDFTQISLIGRNEPTMEYVQIEDRVPFKVGRLKLTPIPVNHIVPTIGVLVEDGDAAIAITSDTYKTDEFWEIANTLTNLKAVFIDCSFPNRLDGLAEVSKHLTPRLVVEESQKLRRSAHIFAVHIKPQVRAEVISEIHEMNRPNFSAAEIGHTYRW